MGIMLILRDGELRLGGCQSSTILDPTWQFLHLGIWWILDKVIYPKLFPHSYSFSSFWNFGW